MKTKVSAVIITYNEAGNLVRTLSQLYWCDEIIVVDSYSTDDTVAICRYYGCKIFHRSFKGHAEQKQFAIGKAVNDWILCIDADEYLTPRLVEELANELEDTGEYAGYTMPRNLVFRGKEFKYGSESYRYHLKLFSRKWSILKKGTGKEPIEVIGQVKKLTKTIQHNGYRNIHQFLSKLHVNSDSRINLALNKKKMEPHALIFALIPFHFIKYYIINRNFLNGINGFYWSVLCAFRQFTEYVKLQDIREMRSDDNDCIINLILSKTPEENSIFLTPMTAEHLN